MKRKKIKINKKHKDRVFRLVFHSKKELLKLYNAMNGTNYQNEDDLTITTIDDVVYMGMKNDMSFIVGDTLNLYEHQSTYSPNLPLRGLLYFADLYRGYIEPQKNKLYSKNKLYIPLPQYIVFYNGTDEEPDYTEIPLSDLFIGYNQNTQPALECKATLLNINLGHNRELMEKCTLLKEYATFVATIRKYMKICDDYETAVNQAVEECIRKNILRDVLRKNRAEVVEVILTEYDEEEFREFLREEIKAEVKEEVKAEVKEEVKAEVKEEVKAEVKEEVKAEVKEEVKAEVKMEAKVEAKVENLLELLEEKGTIPDCLIGKIKAEKELQVVSKWFKSALKAASIKEFEQEMNER